jgi:hypothetical protein
MIDTVPPRKYMSEHAVNLYSARWFIVTPSDLMSGGTMDEDSKDIAQNCHIYMICRRPACAYDSESFKHDGKRLSGKLVYKVKGKTSEVPFDFEFPLLDGAVGVRLADYPHRDFDTLLPSGESVRHLPASGLATSLAHDIALRQLEVLYVGQAYAEGRRSAIDRLKSHTTLQKILADVVQKMPDDEILLLAFEYMPYRIITMMDGIDKNAIRDESDHKRFISIIDNPLTKHQQICLVEAGLIRYFVPPYNEIYKDSFPAADQKILNACYDLDFSALIVEIDTEELEMELFSKAIASSHHHIAKFNLIDPATRRSFFTFVDKDGKAIDFPGVISPSR